MAICTFLPCPSPASGKCRQLFYPHRAMPHHCLSPETKNGKEEKGKEREAETQKDDVRYQDWNNDPGQEVEVIFSLSLANQHLWRNVGGKHKEQKEPHTKSHMVEASRAVWEVCTEFNKLTPD